VEDETLACGTGAVASALAMYQKDGTCSPVRIQTRSGSYLDITFNEENLNFNNIFLQGDARVIYKGELWEEAWNDQ